MSWQQRERDWALAEKMYLTWIEFQATATGTPKQRRVARMLKVLELVREADKAGFNG